MTKGELIAEKLLVVQEETTENGVDSVLYFKLPLYSWEIDRWISPTSARTRLKLLRQELERVIDQTHG